MHLARWLHATRWRADGRAARRRPPRLPSLTRSRRRPRSGGQAMVEFALILPVFLLFLVIAVNFGRLFFSYLQLSNAAREAAAYGATQPTDTVGMQARAEREKNAQAQ